MKKTFKRIVLGLIISTLLMSTVFGAGIKKTIEVVFNKVNITVNGKAVEGENILYEGTTYVPLRAISEMLDKEVGWDGNTNTASINDKSSSESSKDISSTDTTYGFGEWWEVKNQWKLKIDSVSFTDERNKFSDQNPEAVVVIKYTYENLGYEGKVQDLFIKPDNVVDGNKKVVTTYPAGVNVYVNPTPIGAIMEGGEVSYGLTSNKGNLTIYFNEYDDSSTKHKATFIIPLPSKPVVEEKPSKPVVEEKPSKPVVEEKPNIQEEFKRQEYLEELARLETILENVKSEKNIQQLIKKSDGTWGFEYIADPELVARAQRNYDNKYQEYISWENSN